MSIIDISEVLLELGLSASVTDEERAVANNQIMRAESAVKRFLRYDPVLLQRTELYPARDYSYAYAAKVWEVSGNQAVLRQQASANTSELQLRHIPIRSIDYLYVDYDGRSGTQSGAFAAETLKVEGTDYWPNNEGEDSSGNAICRDGIVRSVGSWPTTPGTVKVIYTAGYTDAELHGNDSIIDASGIVDAVILEAARRVRKMFALKKKSGAGFVPGVLTGERMGDYSYTADAVSAREAASNITGIGNDAKMMLAPFVNMSFDMGG